MKYIISIIVFINLLPAICCGQQVMWQNHYGSNEYEGQSYFSNTSIIKSDYDDGYIVCGHFHTLDTITNQYAVKTDSQGNFLWELKAGHPWEIDGSEANIKTFDGNYFIVGNANMQGITANDMRLTKFTENGDTIFTKLVPFSSEYQSGARDICYTPDSNYIAACNSNQNIALMKFDNNGEVLWKTRPLPDSIATTSPVFFQPSPDFSAYYGIMSQNQGQLKKHWFKTDTAGNLLAIKQLFIEANGEPLNEIVKAVMLPSGNIVVHGSDSDGNPCQEGGIYYGTLQEYNQQGEVVKERIFCHNDYEKFEDFFIAADGSVYLIKFHRLQKLNTNWEDEWQYDLDLSEHVWLYKLAQFEYGYLIAAGELWVDIEDTDIFMCKIALPEAIGVEENEEEEFKFNAYPNPTTGQLTVESSLTGITYYTVIAIDGRLVVQGNFTNKTEIDLANTSAGAYHLQLQDHEGKRVYGRVISKQ